MVSDDDLVARRAPAALGAPEGGALGGPSIAAFLEALLTTRPCRRIWLPGSQAHAWEARIRAAGADCAVMHLESRSALDTLMDAAAACGPFEQIWLNLDRQPPLDAMDLRGLDAFLAYAATREHPPLVVLMRDDADPLPRSHRMAVDLHGIVLLLREHGGQAYALGRPEWLLDLAEHGLPARPLPSTFLRGPAKDRHLLVLDIDGVLIDPGRSFHEAVAAALADLAPGLRWTDDHYNAFKRIGGFNNDFRLAAGALALAETGGLGQLDQADGAGFPHLEARMRALEPLCQTLVQKHYARTKRLERPLVGREDLDRFSGELAIFTGRPPEELTLAFQVLGFRLPALSDRAPHLRKPRPEGLLQLADAFKAGRVTFVGDTIDDATALRGARDLCPGVAWTFAAVGPDRDRITEPRDLRGANLKEVLTLLGGRL